MQVKSGFHIEGVITDLMCLTNMLYKENIEMKHYSSNFSLNVLTWYLSLEYIDRNLVITVSDPFTCINDSTSNFYLHKIEYLTTEHLQLCKITVCGILKCS